MLKLKFLICIAGVWLLFAPHLAFSQDYCFEESGKQFGISPVLLWAISQEESMFNPYAINLNRNGTYDYCHMQINSSWANEVGDDVWASLGDPCQCTKVGAWILSQCIKDHGYTWEAVGCYHAKNKIKRIQYAWKIHEALKK
jgi:soluble lytic murein transglycosylase-like protein